MKIVVLITAAGSSERMCGANKIFSLIAGKPTIMHSIEAFEKAAKTNAVIVSVTNDKLPLLKSLCVSYNIKKVIKIVSGGETRQESVWKMLCETENNFDFIAIHDGARPLISQEDINLIFEKCIQYPEGLIASEKAKDTIKIIDENGKITKTPQRKKLRLAQTPQIFESVIIKKAYEEAAKSDFTATDDSSLVEKLGKSVQTIETKYPNPKITYNEDLLYCEVLINGRK